MTPGFLSGAEGDSPLRGQSPPTCLRQDGEDVLVAVRAVPGASRDGIAGTIGDRLKVRVVAPPEGGRANRAVCAAVAAAVGLKAGRVTLERGHGSRDKTLRVRGVRVADLAPRLA